MDHENTETDIKKEEKKCEPPLILDEVNIEELAVDGICGIY